MSYIELQITTNFSFLRGASHPEEMIRQAAALGYSEVAITDRNSVAGIVRAHAAAKTQGMRIITGCRLDLIDGPSLLAYPTNIEAYGRLSALLTTGNQRAEKGKCYLYKADVFDSKQGIVFIILPPERLNSLFDFEAAFESDVADYKQHIKNNLYIAATRTYQGNDHKRLFRINQLSERYQIPMVATNDVYYHDLSRRELQDILTCVREKCTIQDAGFRLQQNAERFLKTQQEMERLFRSYPEAIWNTQQIAEACTFSLDELKYVYPEEIITNGKTPLEELKRLTWQGAKAHFGKKIPEKLLTTIKYEIKFIEEMDYANYFLFVYDIVREARQRGILCQGRGSAANSAVCFCLGITSVNPTKFDLLFERFISSARNEPPDIDVDFEHERREEIIQYIYNKYGRDRAAIVATVTQLRQKGAIRDVGKAIGLSQDTIDKLSAAIWEFTDEWFEPTRLIEQGLNPDDPQLRKILSLTAQLMGFPRQLGQHTGGFIVTQGKLTDLCPIINARMENRTNIEWNKDDIEALGFLKVDVLSLGMLTCIRKAFDMIKEHYHIELTLASIPEDDELVYEMASRADTIGVFQIESRAQQSMLPRLRPQSFYDLVVEVAIVRPGPIQGDMVHPYLRRRNGEEAIDYPSPELEKILNRTYGVPLFQEQAMKIAIVAAGFTPAEADELRRSMATFKFKGLVNKFERKLIDGMVAKGYDEEFARRVFKQLEGFGSYGFPESHAASFALLVYVSLWLKCYYPDVFAAALLNSQPMGFYQPAQIVSDAKNHGVKVLPIDVNYSDWDNMLEPRTKWLHPLRLGFRNIKGLRQDDILLLIAGRKQPYKLITELLDAGVPQAALEKLADADAFRSLGLDRRQALWEVAALPDTPQGLFKGQPSSSSTEQQTELPFMSLAEHVIQDYASTSLSLKAHPVSFTREDLKRINVLSCQQISSAKAGLKVKAAGLVLSRQRPGTAGGVCFITIEDETGTINLVLFEKLFETYRKEILGAKLLMIEGWIQREGTVLHVVVKSCHDLTALLGRAIKSTVDPNLQTASPELPFIGRNRRTQVRESSTGEAIPKARNFR
ncbi:error-prone DNA polymerase [Mucilaginibacter sp. Bleaf8]|uniref:error-prone DNA polymerase n=1 Tax=Mucilaginibacter sp. Bleaf8 TaxID=2834430 RepID=UPI001BCF284F|nr:error-prone DNA polymerase [Mucilaginibacter sp. Bleaf8]MBS7563823.1 error-prone DNA polymerase [Mucilaginibacter sp. Bleaf8]